LFAAWGGLGALVREHPNIRYIFGKLTTHPAYHVAARDALLIFMQLYFPDPAGLARARKQFEIVPAAARYAALFRGDDYAADYATLRTKLVEWGELIPPLMISYFGLTTTMKTFGTARNSELGGVVETGILLPIADINPQARARFIDSYERVRGGYFDNSLASGGYQ
jgi:hypothetical protein